MDDMDYNMADGIGLIELAMRCIQKDNAQVCPTMSQVIKHLRNLSAFQLLNEYACIDKMMKLGDTKKVVMERYVFIWFDYAWLIAK
ncbi:hypothetical protein LguiA_030248 [Lonicera macranthoides]